MMGLEPKEELLADTLRPLYRSFRQMGLSESEAFAAAVGRDGRGSVFDGSGLPIDQVASALQAFGLSEEAAKLGAAGRDRRTYDQIRHDELAEVRSKRDAKPVAERRGVLTEAERRAARRGESVRVGPVKKPESKGGPVGRGNASTELAAVVEAIEAAVAPLVARLEALEGRSRRSGQSSKARPMIKVEERGKSRWL